VELKSHLAKLSTLDGQGLINADVNLDGEVTSMDLLLVKKIILGMLEV
jgi:hypothetical protein